MEKAKDLYQLFSKCLGGVENKYYKVSIKCTKNDSTGLSLIFSRVVIDEMIHVQITKTEKGIKSSTAIASTDDYYDTKLFKDIIRKNINKIYDVLSKEKNEFILNVEYEYEPYSMDVHIVYDSDNKRSYYFDRNENDQLSVFMEMKQSQILDI